MSREIKFRTWIKDEKKYIPDFVEDNDAGDGYGPLEYDNYYLAPETGAIVKHHNHREFGDWMYSVEGTNANREVEVEQYTGLKDKNGKEIYEGDIIKQLMYVLKGKECFTTWVVRWYNDESCYDLHRVSGALYGDSMLSARESKNYEVIGNIHENPELLEGEE